MLRFWKNGLLVLLLLEALNSFAQDGRPTKFGLGFNLGLNTSNGMGAKFIYTPWNLLQAELAAGKTFYNGFKFAGGLKFYPLKRKTINPYLGAYYSMTTGQKVHSTFGLQSEIYRTYANQYFHPHIGATIFGKSLNHTISVGYSLLIGNYKITVDANNTTNENQTKVEKKLQGGIMLSYTIWFYLRRPG